MSYRELRNFTESMRALGYPRLISLDSFRLPNFELVADALYWLVHRYDPTAEVNEDISTEVHRVEFLKSVATVMMSKARVKLNIKQLYRADGYAVKELLKISSLLYDAINLDGGVEGATMGVEEHEQDLAKSNAQADMALTAKLEELKEARNLASEIIDSGAKLFGLLGKEVELRESRDRALAFLDSISLHLESNDPHNQIERNIREQIELLADNIKEMERMREEAERESTTLKAKIDRKQTELERAEKRLKSLKKAKPAFLEEFEAMEAELKHIYDTYLERFRNLHYLESELSKYHTAELEKKIENEKALKRMQKRLREEELRILRGDQPVDENAIDDDDVYDSGKDSDSDSSDLDSDEDSDAHSRKRGGGGMGGRHGRGAVGGRGGGLGGRHGLLDDDSDSDDDSLGMKSSDHDDSDSDSDSDSDPHGGDSDLSDSGDAMDDSLVDRRGTKAAASNMRAHHTQDDDSDLPSDEDSDQDDDDEAF